MHDIKFPIVITCPWSGTGKTFADKPADIKVSCRCHECGKIYHINFNTQRAVKAKANSKNK
jgi:uncharacterized protein (DUF983 family)